MARNWLTPYNYAFALSFVLLGLLIPLRDIPELVALLLRLALVLLGIYLIVGTFLRQKSSTR